MMTRLKKNWVRISFQVRRIDVHRTSRDPPKNLHPKHFRPDGFFVVFFLKIIFASRSNREHIFITFLTKCCRSRSDLRTVGQGYRRRSQPDVSVQRRTHCRHAAQADGYFTNELLPKYGNFIFKMCEKLFFKKII